MPSNERFVIKADRLTIRSRFFPTLEQAERRARIVCREFQTKVGISKQTRVPGTTTRWEHKMDLGTAVLDGNDKVWVDVAHDACLLL